MAAKPPPSARLPKFGELADYCALASQGIEKSADVPVARLSERRSTAVVRAQAERALYTVGGGFGVRRPKGKVSIVQSSKLVTHVCVGPNLQAPLFSNALGTMSLRAMQPAPAPALRTDWVLALYLRSAAVTSPVAGRGRAGRPSREWALWSARGPACPVGAPLLPNEAGAEEGGRRPKKRSAKKAKKSSIHQSRQKSSRPPLSTTP